MKKLILVISLAILITGCGVKELAKVEGSYDVYYFNYNYVLPTLTTTVSKINTETLEDKLLINTEASISMLNYENNKLYGVFNNRLGYILDNQIQYVTNEDVYVNRSYVYENNIYFGKDNSNASDNIYEHFAVTDLYGNQKDLHEAGVSNLVVDEFVYFKPNSGSEINNLLQYKLDGTEKKILYTGNFGLLTLSDQYIYFINYTDNNSLYRMNRDGNNPTKIADGSFTFNTFNVNMINGEYKLATVGDALYYINSKDDYKLYKYDGKNIKVTDEGILSVKSAGNALFVIYKNRSGLFMLNLDGSINKQLLNINPTEYDID